MFCRTFLIAVGVLPKSLSMPTISSFSFGNPSLKVSFSAGVNVANPLLNFILPRSVSFCTSWTKLSASSAPNAAWLFTNAFLNSLSGFCNSLLNKSNASSSANAFDKDSLRPRITAPSLNM